MTLPPDTAAAIRHYEQVLAAEPDFADGYFNLALLYKRARRYTDAVTAYQRAIALDIEHVEEAYSNLGVLYSEQRRGDLARQMYEKALAVEPRYVPALFNLAGLLEEAGERQPAIDLYRRILDIDPGHWEALSRLAYAQRVTSSDATLIGELRMAITAAEGDGAAREGLSFALGKALDDVGDYAAALDAYRAGNELSRLRHPPYDRRAAESVVDGLQRSFDREWLQRAETGRSEAPIFICGMYRSGSTLAEQILAAHPAVEMGGELDVLPWLLTERLQPFPGRLQAITASGLEPLATEYLAELQRLFPGAAHVTDKRPDNFVHLGAIRAMFPAAKIVYTRRAPRDNCLSVYFQQLGSSLRYASDLADIAHYYRQHERLMAHWQGVLGENIFTLDYDELVRNPESVLRPLLRFLDLPWDDRCLNFQRARSRVKTASVWQVREPLHTRSSGRWQHYAPFLAEVDELRELGE